MARRSDPNHRAATVILVIGLLLAALSGTCTLLPIGDLFKSSTPAERYGQGYAALFIYVGSLVFGGVLALTAFWWRSVLGRAWSDPPSRFRLAARRVIASGFALVVIAMAAIGLRGVRISDGAGLIFLLLITGVPAALFGYGAYRAWARPRKAARSDERPA